MHQPFNTFERMIDFTFWKETCLKHGTKQTFRRGEYFAHTGETIKSVGWIISGGFKHSLIDNSGNAKAVGFVFEGSILANYISAMHGKPIPTDIIALEDSEVVVIPASMIRDRVINDPELNLKFAQALFEQAYDFVLDIYRCSPEQRYRRLIDRYPRILDLVPLNEIASYLDISRRQLHRIRRLL